MANATLLVGCHTPPPRGVCVGVAGLIPCQGMCWVLGSIPIGGVQRQLIDVSFSHQCFSLSSPFLSLPLPLHSSLSNNNFLKSSVGTVLGSPNQITGEKVAKEETQI